MITDPNLRWMIRRDMPEVVALEQHDTFPWNEEEWILALRQRNRIGMVFTRHNKYEDSPIIGTVCFSLFKLHLSLNKLTIHTDHRRSGIGSRIMHYLTGKLRSHGRREIYVSVGETNPPGLLFFKSWGFKSAGVERDVYADTEGRFRDMIMMRYELPHYVPVPSPGPMDTAELGQSEYGF